MSTFTLPNIVTGGQIQVQGNSLADAQQQAASQTGVSLSAQQGGGTFGVNSSNSVGGGSSGGGGNIQGGAAATSASGAGVQQLLSALGSGNKAAADELIREFNQTFGLDQNKFQESIRQYNQTFGLTQTVDQANIAAQAAGLTGWYTPPGSAPSAAAGMAPGTVVRTPDNQFGVVGPNGAITPGDASNPAIYAAIQANHGINTIPSFGGGPQQTLAGQLQQANLSGLQANGQPTEQARQFNLQTGLQGLQLASSLQANPFRQAQALYGLGQDGYTPLLRAAAGTGPGVTAFQAPTLSAADTATLPWLAAQTGGNSFTADQSTAWMNGLGTPVGTNWPAVNQAGPGATNLVQQGLAQKGGLDPQTIAAIQQQAMPGFQAPTLSGAFKG
jgi:hypothetical protein